MCDVTQEQYEDAIIEDTVHCDFCGTSWVLGGGDDGVIIDNPALGPHMGAGTMPQLKLCIDCAGFVARCFEDTVKGKDQCQHGVITGNWCQPCHAGWMQEGSQ